MRRDHSMAPSILVHGWNKVRLTLTMAETIDGIV
jgi:hypothetical protein